MGHAGRPERGSAPWWRYVLLAGLERAPEKPGPPLEPVTARRLRLRLERIGKLDVAADYLWQRAFHLLKPDQQRYVRGVTLPAGSCTCPCSTTNPVVSKTVAMLLSRAGGPAEPLVLPDPLPPEEKGIPPGLPLLQGLLEMDVDPELRLDREQARQMLQIVTVAGGALDTIESDTEAIWKELSREDRIWMARHGDGWLGGRTGTDLEAEWEQWHHRALVRMEEIGATGRS